MWFIYKVLLYATLISVVRALEITEIEHENLIEDIKEIGNDGQFTVVTHEFDFDGDMSTKFNNLEEKIEDRENAMEQPNLQPVVNTNDPHLNLKDKLRDFKNNLNRGDPMLIHYEAERLESVRTVFNIAKAKYTRRIGIIKKPIKKSGKTYTLISAPATKDLQENVVIQGLLKGILLAVETAQAPIHSGNWMNFRDQMFNQSKLALTSILNRNDNGTNKNETITERDDYLLAFIILGKKLANN